MKNYSDYSPNPLIILPLLSRAYGGFIITKKAFRLGKQFENAEYTTSRQFQDNNPDPFK